MALFNNQYRYFNAKNYCIKSDQSNGDVASTYKSKVYNTLIQETRHTEFEVQRYSFCASGALPILDMSNLAPSITISGVFGVKNVTATVPLVYSNRYGSNSQGASFVYNMYHFIDMVNQCFQSCYTSLASQAIGYTIQSVPPFITFDGTLFQIYTDNTAYGTVQNGTNEHLNIVFSNDLFNLLKNFNYSTDFLNNSTLLISSSILDKVTIGSVNYTVNKQLSKSTSIWSPVESILFKTNLQVVPEIYGDINILGQATTSNVQQGDEQIITDITIDVSGYNDWNEHIVFIPSKDRLINMGIVNDIDMITYSVWWVHKNGQQYQLNLPNMGFSTSKVLFKKRII